jgi:hypothetical protein
MNVRKLHPSGLVPESLAAKALDFINQGGLGLPALAAAADVVAADCRHNAWVATEVKRAGLSDDEWMQFLDDGERIEERAVNAMRAFAADGDHDELCVAFAEVATLLNARLLPSVR